MVARERLGQKFSVRKRGFTQGLSAIGGLLLPLAVSGCTPGPLGGSVGYDVWHDIPANEAVCTGDLKGRLSAGETVMFESPVVPLGENYNEFKERAPTGQGDSVKAEGCCYSATGEEIGYIAAEGVLVPSYSVSHFGPSYSSPSCLTGNEVRGTAALASLAASSNNKRSKS